MEDEIRRNRVHRRRVFLLIGGIVLSVALTIVLVFAIFSFAGKMAHRYQLDEKTRTYLEAIIDADNDKLHSVCYDQSLDVQTLIDALTREEISLEGEVEIGATRSVQINLVNKDLSANAAFNVLVGGEAYIVTVEYRRDDGGDGIRSFFIKPR